MTEEPDRIGEISYRDIDRFLADETIDESALRLILADLEQNPDGELAGVIRRRLEAEVQASGRQFEELWNEVRRRAARKPDER